MRFACMTSCRWLASIGESATNVDPQATLFTDGHFCVLSLAFKLCSELIAARWIGLCMPASWSSRLRLGRPALFCSFEVPLDLSMTPSLFLITLLQLQ